MLQNISKYNIINKEFKIIRKEKTSFIQGEIGVNTITSPIEILERRSMTNNESWLCLIDLRKAYEEKSKPSTNTKPK